MFSEKDIRLYQSIQAPESLRQRVLSQRPAEAPVSRKRGRAGALLIAACIALVLVTALPPKAPVLRHEGQTIGRAAVAVSRPAESESAARAVSFAPVEIPLELAEEAEAAVSHGELLRDGGRLTWYLPPDAKEATLTVTQKKKTTLYFLHADADGVRYMEKK